MLGETGSRRIDTLVHDLVEHSEAAGDIVQGPVVGRAMLRLRTFMFEHVYLGPAARDEHAKIERVLRGLFDWYCEHPEELPEGVAGRHGGRSRDRLPGRDDRPLRDPRLDASASCRRASPGSDGALHAGIAGAGPRRGRLRGARRRAHGAQARRHAPAAGPVPVPRGADPVVRDRPRGEALPLLRLRGGRRRLLVRDGDRGAGLRRRAGVAGRAGGRRARARERGSARRREARAAGPPAGAAGAHGRLLRARAVGERRGGAGAREYLLGRGLDEGALREFRVGYSPSRWDRVLVASRTAGFSEEELLAAGLASRSRDGSGRLFDRFRGRIMFPLADERGRVLGFGARALGEGQRPKYLNTSRRRGLPQGADRLRRRPRARGGRAGGPGGARRGLHGRDRAAPGGRAGGGRARWARR